MKIIRIIGGFVLVLLALSAIFLMLGLMVPSEFQGSMGREIKRSQQDIWKILNDVESLPDRNPAIQGVEIIKGQNGNINTWKEYLGNKQYVVLEVIERIEPEKMTIQVQKTNTGFMGTFGYDIEKRGDNLSYVRVWEKSELKRLFLRAFMFWKGRDYFLKDALKQLEN